MGISAWSSRSRLLRAGSRGRHDQIDADIEAKNRRVEHHVVEARVLAIDAIRAPDVIGPRSVLVPLPPLRGLAVDSIESHAQLHAALPRPGKVDVQRPRHGA